MKSKVKNNSQFSFKYIWVVNLDFGGHELDRNDFWRLFLGYIILKSKAVCVGGRGGHGGVVVVGGCDTVGEQMD